MIKAYDSSMCLIFRIHLYRKPNSVSKLVQPQKYQSTSSLLVAGGSAGSAIQTLATVGLVAGTLLHAPMLRGLEQGREWVIYLLAVTFATDTGALVTGLTIGRHKMAPSVSPGKTWEGAIGGFVVAVGIALAVGALLQLSAPQAHPLPTLLPPTSTAQTPSPSRPMTVLKTPTSPP